MRLDVAAAAALRVRAQKMPHAVEQAVEPAAGGDFAERGFVQRGEFDQSREVGGRPVAVHIGLGEADVAAEHQAAHRAPAVQDQGRARAFDFASAFDARAGRRLDREMADLERAQDMGDPAVGKARMIEYFLDRRLAVTPLDLRCLR